jgi:predicted DNA-binding protein with PD1-like motif
MRTRLLTPTGETPRTFVVVFDSGEEMASGLLDVARAQELRGASLGAIGALASVTLGWWDPDAKDYRRIELREQVEVLSLLGNVAAAPDGGVKVHAHLVVGDAKGRAHGGHLLEARVHPTLEVIVVESPSHLQRRHDPATGLALLEP